MLNRLLLIALIATHASPALAKRTIYFAQGVLGNCRTGAKLHYPSAGYGVGFVIFNASSVDQTISLNVTVEYTGQGVGQKKQNCVLSSLALGAGKSAMQGCAIPPGWPDALTGGMIQVYGQVESVDATGRDAGYVVASGNIWACIRQLVSGTAVSDPSNFPFAINGGKPF